MWKSLFRLRMIRYRRVRSIRIRCNYYGLLLSKISRKGIFLQEEGMGTDTNERRNEEWPRNWRNARDLKWPRTWQRETTEQGCPLPQTSVIQSPVVETVFYNRVLDASKKNNHGPGPRILLISNGAVFGRTKDEASVLSGCR